MAGAARAVSTVVSLLTLPDEMLLKVGLQLVAVPDLFSLLAVCKRLRRQLSVRLWQALWSCPLSHFGFTAQGTPPPQFAEPPPVIWQSATALPRLVVGRLRAFRAFSGPRFNLCRQDGIVKFGRHSFLLFVEDGGKLYCPSCYWQIGSWKPTRNAAVLIDEVLLQRRSGLASKGQLDSEPFRLLLLFPRPPPPRTVKLHTTFVPALDDATSYRKNSKLQRQDCLDLFKGRAVSPPMASNSSLPVHCLGTYTNPSSGETGGYWLATLAHEQQSNDSASASFDRRVFCEDAESELSLRNDRSHRSSCAREASEQVVPLPTSAELWSKTIHNFVLYGDIATNRNHGCKNMLMGHESAVGLRVTVLFGDQVTCVTIRC